MKHRRIGIIVVIITAVSVAAVESSLLLRAVLPLFAVGGAFANAGSVGIIGGADGPATILATSPGISCFTIIAALVSLAGAAYLIINGRK